MFEKLSTIQKILLVDILIVIGLAIMDIKSIPLWGTNGISAFFWSFATLVILVASFTYYIITKDRSEAFALGIGAKLGTMFLFEDTFFYLIKFKTIGETEMPHLMNHYMGGFIAGLLRHTTFTPSTLIITNIIGGIIIYFVVKYLIEKY